MRKPRGCATKLSILVSQAAQLKNLDCRIVIGEEVSGSLLANYVSSIEGLSTGDSDRFYSKLLGVPQEQPRMGMVYPERWRNLRIRRERGSLNVIRWEHGRGSLHSSPTAHNFPSRIMNGRRILGERGLRITQMGSFIVTLYIPGEIFREERRDHCSAHDSTHLTAAVFCSSPE